MGRCHRSVTARAHPAVRRAFRRKGCVSDRPSLSGRAATRRRLLAAALAAAAALPVAAQPALSLAQRRAIAAYEADILPGLLARLAEAAGKAIPVEIDMAAIAKPDLAHLYGDPDFWTKVYFEPLIAAFAAFAAVARDAMGREAVAAGVTGIRITRDPATAPMTNHPNGLTFADGVLTVNFEPCANSGDVGARATAIQTIVDAGL